MTFEKKCTIDPQGIIAIELGCGNCGASTSVPIEHVNPASIARFAKMECGFCHTLNGFADDTAELDALRKFLEVAAVLPNAMRGRNMRLRMGIRLSE
jgi:hypothetical protein